MRLQEQMFSQMSTRSYPEPPSVEFKKTVNEDQEF